MDLSSLNPEQARAVQHRDGPILVLAGAGSGKTRVITTRIAWLIANGVAPESILGVTFTNKAAAEMRERVAHLVPAEVARRVQLGTFHALGAWLLRAEIRALGFDPRFNILDEGDRRRVMRDVLKELKLGDDRGAQRVLSIVSKAKGARTTPARLPEARYNPEMPRAQRVFDLYNQALRNLNAVDFDDLLLLPTRIFDDHADIREKYRQRFRYVLVDEYQDTNPIQMHLLDQLVARPKMNLMAVGDDDQSIYRFRGAVADNILRFGEHFVGSTVVALEQNYRSVSSVLALANGVIAQNPKRHPKTLWSSLGAGDAVAVIGVDDEIAEADLIVQRIAAAASTDGRPYDDFAILYRSNTQTATLEEALRKNGIPYRVLGGQSLFDRKEIKDALAYFRLVLNARDELSLRRVINYPTRGVGTETLAKLDADAKASGRKLGDVVRERVDAGTAGQANKKLADFFAAIDTARDQLRRSKIDEVAPILTTLLESIGLERAIKADEKNPNVARIRWQGVQELIDRLGQYTRAETGWGALEEYVQVVTLETGAGAREREEDTRGRVTMSTIHSSKGLEFPVVFVCGVSDDLLPHHNAAQEVGGVEEERRLFYVAITRAQRSLTLTWSQFVVVRGMRSRRLRSRFLDGLPPDLFETASAAPVAEQLEARDTLIAERFAQLRAIATAKR